MATTSTSTAIAAVEPVFTELLGAHSRRMAAIGLDA